MPNRILREGILTSEAVNSLSWAEETFYRRLMSVVDDFGRYYASPKLLRAACYPLHIDKVSDADVGKWLTSCVTAALVSVYPASDGKRYLEVLNFKQQVRAKDSKFPHPIGECVADAQQVHSSGKASAHLDVDVFEDVSEDDKAPRKRVAPPDGVSDSVWQDFQKTRRAKKAPVTDTAMDGIRREAQKAGITLEKALQTCCERGWTGFKAEWLTETKRGPSDPTSTVPSKPGIDPALAKAIADAKLATKPPPEIVQRMKELTGART